MNAEWGKEFDCRVRSGRENVDEIGLAKTSTRSWNENGMNRRDLLESVVTEKVYRVFNVRFDLSRCVNTVDSGTCFGAISTNSVSVNKRNAFLELPCFFVEKNDLSEFRCLIICDLANWIFLLFEYLNGCSESRKSSSNHNNFFSCHFFLRWIVIKSLYENSD